MVVKNNQSSIGYNTFGIEVGINTFIEINYKEDLAALRESLVKLGCYILGGGSNILLTADLAKPVVQINTKGRQVVFEEEAYVLVQIAAGESWHETVLWAVEQNYGGIENLALIPGKCGAAPIQNIGAYGIELKDVLHSVKAFKLEDGNEYTFHREECGFGYRTSHFKTTWKNQFVVTDLILKLTKPGHHVCNTSYGAIDNELEKRGEAPSIQSICKVVTAIRQAKLPYPEEVGNAGSFFKNPIIPITQYKTLAEQYPTMPSYPVDDQSRKIPAGWLIDQCGWKGKVVGNTGTYKNQALVIVNHGGATGQEIYKLSEAIKTSVVDRYGVELEREVNVW